MSRGRKKHPSLVHRMDHDCLTVGNSLIEDSQLTMSMVVVMMMMMMMMMMMIYRGLWLFIFEHCFWSLYINTLIGLTITAWYCICSGDFCSLHTRYGELSFISCLCWNHPNQNFPMNRRDFPLRVLSCWFGKLTRLLPSLNKNRDF